MATVIINGKEMTVSDGTLILDAARDAGFDIPTFCYQADLAGLGSCRMCLVEIEGQRKLQPSCVTPVIDGMNIMTESPTVQDARSSMLEFLLSNHALDCPVCDKGGECELQDMVFTYGPRRGRHAEKKKRFHDRDYRLSPVIVKNSNRCVQCQKCVRVCSEVVGAGVLGSIGRGEDQEETSFLKKPLDCDHCGNCIEVCPVGCFMRAPYRYTSRPWDLKGADSICPYCATGCRLVVEERDGVVVRSRAQLGVGLNSETLCARGRFGYDYVSNAERISTPLVRKERGLVVASWEEALDAIRENVKAGMGPRAGGVASPRLTNEELYLFGRFMRDIIGTPNVDSSSRWDPDLAADFIAATEMADGGVSVFDAMESDMVFVVGSHISDENPVTDYIIRRISATRFMEVVIASPRPMKLDSSATATVRHGAASEGELLSALALALRDLAGDALAGHAGLASLGRTFEDLAAAAGVTPAGLKDVAARLRAAETVTLMAGTEFLRRPGGIAGLDLLKDVLRSSGKRVTMMPLLDRCNQRGAWEMGAHPALRAGYRAASSRGLGTAGMLEAASAGKLDMLYLAGVDPVSISPGRGFVAEALGKVGFLVVQDMFLTETAKLAHVVLPSAGASEKGGTFTNQEGRVQEITALLPPPGKARTDLDIIRSIGRLFDGSFGGSAREVFEEIRLQTPMYREVSLKFNNIKNKENRLDVKEALVAASGERLASSARLTASGAADPARPFVLITGNQLFGSGTLSGRSEIIQSLGKGPAVEISAEDAEAMGLSDGQKVKVTGERSEATLTLRTARGSARGVAFIAENYADVPVNRFFAPGEGSARVSITEA